MNYIPSNWFWIIGGDETQAFSSAVNAYVPSTDPALQAWVAAGNVPTAIDTPANLRAVLGAAGIAPYAPVSPRQARLALLAAGLLDQVTAAVTSAGGATLITWEYATQFQRDDPMIAAIGAALNLTSDQIDALFKSAAAF